jgi:hypothetical protein
MQNRELLAVPERKAFMFAVWPRELYPFPWLKTVIGTTFDPKPGFKENCNRLVVEKITRQFEHDDICSAATRDPENGLWEGSVSFVINGIEWAFSASGLKGREDQAIGIMVPCVIMSHQPCFESSRIEKILEICEAYPDLKGITEYTGEVFDAVFRDLS